MSRGYIARRIYRDGVLQYDSQDPSVQPSDEDEDYGPEAGEFRPKKKRVHKKTSEVHIPEGPLTDAQLETVALWEKVLSEPHYVDTKAYYEAVVRKLKTHEHTEDSLRAMIEYVEAVEVGNAILRERKGALRTREQGIQVNTRRVYAKKMRRRIREIEESLRNRSA